MQYSVVKHLYILRKQYYKIESYDILIVATDVVVCGGAHSRLADTP